MGEENERELVSRAQRGDIEAFADLVRLHQANVLACLAVRLDSPDDAEDLAQEVFIVAFRRLVEFDPGRPFGPWLRGIAHNLLRNHRRKYRPAVLGRLEDLRALADAAIEAAHAEGGEERFLGAMEGCLEGLDAGSRRLLRLRYGESVPIGELCRRTGKKHSAVTMWLHRIRLALRDCIERRLAESSP